MAECELAELDAERHTTPGDVWSIDSSRLVRLCMLFVFHNLCARQTAIRGSCCAIRCTSVNPGCAICVDALRFYGGLVSCSFGLRIVLACVVLCPSVYGVNSCETLSWQMTVQQVAHTHKHPTKHRQGCTLPIPRVYRSTAAAQSGRNKVGVRAGVAGYQSLRSRQCRRSLWRYGLAANLPCIGKVGQLPGGGPQHPRVIRATLITSN